MKTITIHQPFASLIAWGFKRYETRHWTTRYRGNIAIHSGRKWTRTMQEYWEDLCDSYPELKGYRAVELPLGCIVAACTLVDVHRVETVCPAGIECVVGNFANGELGKNLAKEYGVARSQISRIVNNRRWNK